MLNGAGSVADARWFVEQQPQELSVCISQLQRSRQSESQSWFSGGLRFGVSTPYSSELVEGIRSGVHQGVQSAPVRKETTSEHKTEPDSLVALSNGCPVHLFAIDRLAAQWQRMKADGWDFQGLEGRSH